MEIGEAGVLFLKMGFVRDLAILTKFLAPRVHAESSAFFAENHFPAIFLRPSSINT